LTTPEVEDLAQHVTHCATASAAREPWSRSRSERSR
jgi:hypothetical protein